MAFWVLHHNLAFVFAYPILSLGLVPGSACCQSLLAPRATWAFTWSVLGGLFGKDCSKSKSEF